MPFRLEKNGLCLISDKQEFVAVDSPGNGNGAYAIDKDGYLWSWGNNEHGNCGQGDPEYIDYSTGYNKPENAFIVKPQLVKMEDVSDKNDWVKIMQGEFSVIAMDKDGRLWGAGMTDVKDNEVSNCAPFGLPHDSGKDLLEWKEEARENYKYWHFKFVRCAPGFTCKDFMHNYYYTQMIGNDDLLYVMGWEWGSGYGGSGMGTSEDYWEEPTQSPYVTDKIKSLLADGAFGTLGGAVTLDNKVLIWGEAAYYWYDGYDSSVQYVVDITNGLPSDQDIIKLMGGEYVLLVLLENGDVYARGGNSHIGRGYSGEDSWYEWVKIDQLSNIRDIGVSQVSPWAISEDNDFYTWSGWGYYETGKEVENCQYADHEYPEVATTCKWKTVTNNYYHLSYHGIDLNGQLYTWGSNSLSPQLGIGVSGTEAENDALGIEENEVEESCDPIIADYDEGVEYTGGAGPFNTQFMDTPIQEETHFPCGHWHKREWYETTEDLAIFVSHGQAIYIWSIPPISDIKFNYRFCDVHIEPPKDTTREPYTKLYHDDVDDVEELLDKEVVYGEDEEGEEHSFTLLDGSFVHWTKEDQGVGWEDTITISQEEMATAKNRYLSGCNLSPDVFPGVYFHWGTHLNSLPSYATVKEGRMHVSVFETENQRYFYVRMDFAYTISGIYQSEGDAEPDPTRIIPFWPFEKNVHFRRTSDTFTFDEQQEKMGYMEDEFYDQFNENDLPGLEPEVYDPPEFGYLDDYSEGLPVKEEEKDRPAYLELHYKNTLPAAGQGEVEDFILYQKQESDPIEDGRRFKFYVPPGTIELSFSCSADDGTHVYMALNRVPNTQVPYDHGVWTIEELEQEDRTAYIPKESTSLLVLDEDVNTEGWNEGRWVTGILSIFQLHPDEYTVTITVDTDHPAYSQDYDSDAELGNRKGYITPHEK